MTVAETVRPFCLMKHASFSVTNLSSMSWSCEYSSVHIFNKSPSIHSQHIGSSLYDGRYTSTVIFEYLGLYPHARSFFPILQTSRILSPSSVYLTMDSLCILCLYVILNMLHSFLSRHLQLWFFYFCYFLLPRFVSDELICETCKTKTIFKCHFKQFV